MISDKARRWAEAVFKKEERDRDGRAAMTEYQAPHSKLAPLAKRPHV